MKMVKFTSSIDGRPIFVNTALVKSVFKTFERDDESTIIEYGYDCYQKVIESVETVVSMLEGE